MEVPTIDLEQLELDAHVHADTSSGDDEVEEGVEVKAEAETETQQYNPPSEELQKRLVQQLEFYFSDANILKDPFLLKHVRADPDGFVSLKLLASFHKIQKMTFDVRDIKVALRNLSKKLEMNAKETRVRRKEPLPDWDDNFFRRTVVAINAQAQLREVTVESVKEYFGKFGEVSLVRILRPNQPLPLDLKPFQFRHPELGAQHAVIVEFERPESAEKTLKQLSGKDDWRGMKVLPLKPMKKSPEEKVAEEVKKKTRSPDIPRKKEIKPEGSPLSSSPASLSSSPWLQKRLAAQAQDLLHRENGQRVTALRQPRGPDGTKGFADRVVASS